MSFLSYGMRAFNWFKDFEESPIVEDIPRRVQTLEKAYIFWAVVNLVLLMAGVMILMLASTAKIELLGLFIAIEGLAHNIMNANCANAHLASYRILWDTQNRLRREMNKMSSTDL